jgi:hypothetical protein
MKPGISYFKWEEWRALNGEFHGISKVSALEKLKLLVGVLAQHQFLGVASVISNSLHWHLQGVARLHLAPIRPGFVALLSPRPVTMAKKAKKRSAVSRGLLYLSYGASLAFEFDHNTRRAPWPRLDRFSPMEEMTGQRLRVLIDLAGDVVLRT